MSERAVPFHCPYCGEEDLRPPEDPLAGSSIDGAQTDRVPHGTAWYCAACLRTFSLKLIGIGTLGGLGPPSTPREQEVTR